MVFEELRSYHSRVRICFIRIDERVSQMEVILKLMRFALRHFRAAAIHTRVGNAVYQRYR